MNHKNYGLNPIFHGEFKSVLFLIRGGSIAFINLHFVKDQISYAILRHIFKFLDHFMYSKLEYFNAVLSDIIEQLKSNSNVS